MILDNVILWDTDYGIIHCNLRKIMRKNNISIYRIMRLTGIKYDVIRRYYDDNITKYDANILAKLCYSLNCSINEIMEYKKSK